MPEMSAIKMEARMLLNEVNQYFECLPGDGADFTSYTVTAGYGGEYSFKEKLRRLKEKIREASYTADCRNRTPRQKYNQA
ncbi:MAG: hypothetical protein ABJA78_09915 [Ferruginibacter sp.]